MSLKIIRAALEKKLAALTPAVSISFENIAFTPTVGVPYLKVTLLPNTPDNSIMGQGSYFERGIFQISACYPMGAGTGLASDKVQAICGHFKRGVTMVESGVTVIVMDTPRVATAIPDGDRYCVPISMSYQAQIIT